jgi:hypothetical protein
MNKQNNHIASKYIIVITIAIIAALTTVSFLSDLPPNNSLKTVTIIMIVSVVGILECEIEGKHEKVLALFGAIAGFVLGSM